MLAFPSPKYNPAVPTGPGKPGLIFSVQHKMLDHIASLFVKEDTAVPVWKYYGQYKSGVCGKMEKKLWMMQPVDVSGRLLVVIFRLLCSLGHRGRARPSSRDCHVIHPCMPG